MNESSDAVDRTTSENAVDRTTSENAVDRTTSENAVDRTTSESVGEQKLLGYVEMGSCDHCGRKVPKEKLIDARNENGELILICDECCKGEDFVECNHCGDIVDKSYAKADDYGNYVCDECRDLYYTKCYDCGRVILIDDANEIGEQYFCDDCAENWTTCEDCDRLIHRDEEVWTHDDTQICDRCYERNYDRCADCNEIFLSEEMYWNEHDECYYCENCECDHHYENDGLMSYHSFSRARYEPRVSNGENKYANNLLLGVELECDKGIFDIDNFGDWTEDDDLIHFEEDGSLSTSGVELITMPCTLKFHQNEMRWRDLLKTLVEEGFCSHNTDNCGLHIHLSRAALMPSTIVKMDVFVNRAHEFFSKIARRDVFYSAHYIPDKKAMLGKGLVDYSGHSGRYTAVNTTNDNTVEIRIFRGTLKYQTLIGTIELCDALPHFLENISIAHIYDTEDNIVKFIDYIGEHSDIYPHAMLMMHDLVRDIPASANIDWWYRKQINKEIKELRKCA